MSSSDAPSRSGPSRRLIVAVGLAVSAFLLVRMVVTINLTESVPRGAYLVLPPGTPGLDAPAVGDLVVACAPALALVDTALARGYLKPSGACPSGATPLLKRVFATSGRTVRLDTTGLAVDGRRVQPAPRTADSAGRPLPPGYIDVRLGPGELWLASDSERGFDSRYLGVFGPELVRARAFPIVHF